MEISANQRKAAQEIVELIALSLGDNRSIHPGTAITSCARLAGSFMFRSFNFQVDQLKPGSAVLSDEANKKGPMLVNVFQWMLHNFGVELDSEKLNEKPAESHHGFIETLNLLQDKARLIMNANNLNFELMAYACSMATGFLVKECRMDLPAEVGFGTAIYGFIEGSKTFPPPFSETSQKKKSIFTFWK
ncbi:MAG: hypothetical protein JNK18_05285 [Cyclobacteriaceae bacterium]|nr:hypothetical protein [Cyclobacteriaceae bacterium]